MCLRKTPLKIHYRIQETERTKGPLLSPLTNGQWLPFLDCSTIITHLVEQVIQHQVCFCSCGFSWPHPCAAVVILKLSVVNFLGVPSYFQSALFTASSVRCSDFLHFPKGLQTAPCNGTEPDSVVLAADEDNDSGGLMIAQTRKELCEIDLGKSSCKKQKVLQRDGLLTWK